MDLIICLNKPKGITSQTAVSSVKRTLRVKKAGHTGTLDPMATGLLLVCVNKATRLAAYFADFDKGYTAVMKLGETTDTQDAEGIVIEKAEILNIDEALLKDTLNSFKGRVLQTPPMFSALKHKGKPLYKYARKGIEIERKAREVNISSIELLSFNSPFVKFRVDCSKGTYIRTLCDDMGKMLGVGAHLYELERTDIGHFNIKDGLSIEELRLSDPGNIQGKGIYTMDRALSWMPELRITESLALSVKHGNPIRMTEGLRLSDDIKKAVGIKIKLPDGKLVAVGSFSPEKDIVKMNIVFSH